MVDISSLYSSIGLCQRRHWPEPLFEACRTHYGWSCVVRVNNREYQTETEYHSEDLARNAAAARAYMICRNFSVNDGMYPGQRQGQGGVVQGLPVAIGAGRRKSSSAYAPEAGFLESGSGPSSPRSSDSEFDNDSRSGSGSELKSICYCGRGTVRAYERCSHCLHERGWR